MVFVFPATTRFTVNNSVYTKVPLFPLERSYIELWVTQKAESTMSSIQFILPGAQPIRRLPISNAPKRSHHPIPLAWADIQATLYRGAFPPPCPRGTDIRPKGCKNLLRCRSSPALQVIVGCSLTLSDGDALAACPHLGPCPNRPACCL